MKSKHNKRRGRPRSLELLRQLFHEAKSLCAFCQQKTFFPSMLPYTKYKNTATLDHYVPVTKGGKDERENYRLACNDCNSRKSDMLPEEWESYMTINPGWWNIPHIECLKKWRKTNEQR